MDKVRWGIIGCGDVCEVKSGPAFQKADGSELVAVMRRDADKAEDFARRHDVPKWYNDADKLIDDPDVTAVYVATPPHVHAKYTIRAAQAGKPVYVEKPMARNFAECRTMIDACEDAGVPLFVAYYRRRLPAFLKVKELVDTGAVGDVRFVNIRLTLPAEKDLDPANPPWRVVPEIGGGGLFLDLGSHILDYLDYVFGPVTEATGHSANQGGLYEAEDIVTGSFVFESGVPGTCTFCFTVPEACEIDRTEIAGSAGSITFPNFAVEPIRLKTGDGVEEFSPPKPEHVHQPLVQTVVDELHGRGTCPSTGRTGSRTTWVMDQMLNDWRASR
jgi:predicted dehydrogenase